MFNIKIIELAYVHKVIYEDDQFHYEVSYLVQQGENELVVNVHPTSLESLMELPKITIDTPIQYMKHEGNISKCTLTTSVRELDQTDPTMPMGPNGNVRID